MNVAERALGMATETKVIRRVRTLAGVRRYKQPIGSIIIADSLLVGLTDKGTTKQGHNLVEGTNGKTYTIRRIKRTNGRSQYVAQEGTTLQGEIIADDASEMEVYAQLAQRVQQEAGIDTRGAGRLGSSGKHEGWTENQVQAAGDEISAWGNSMEEYGHGLQEDVYGVSSRLADGMTPHRDIRVARHELEQLRDRARQADRDPINADAVKFSGGAESTLDAAINVAVTEGKLPRKYDPQVEAAYAADALKRAKTDANKPRPIKTSQIGIGMWIRETDKEGNPQGDWFHVRDIGEQSITPGRSRLIQGLDQNGKMVTRYRMSPRNYWQTVNDPQDVADGPTEPSATPAVPRGELPAVSANAPTYKPVPSEYDGYGKFELANGRTVYTDADDESIDVYDENDNLLANFKLGKDFVQGMNALGAGDISDLGPADDLPSLPPGVRNLTPAVSEYEGYEKFTYPNGMPAYIKKGKGNLWDAWDQNDTRIRSEKTRDGLLKALDREAGGPAPEAAAPVAEVEATPTLKRLKSKFAGWKRYKMPDGKVIDVGQATEDDNRFYATGKGGWDDIVADGDTEDEVMRKLNTMIGIEQPVTFSPSNTDVAPKRDPKQQGSPIAGMSWEDYQRGLERGRRVSGAITGQRDPFEGRGQRQDDDKVPAFARRGDDPNEARKAPNVERAEDRDERLYNEAMLREDNGPRLGLMKPGEAAHDVHRLADEFDPTSRASTTARRIGRELQEGHISTEEAIVELGRHTINQPDMAIRQRFNEVAERLRSADQRTPEEIRADARAKRAKARASNANEINIPKVSRSEAAAVDPNETALSALDRNPNEVLRNNRPLKDSDAKLLNLNGDAPGASERRLVPPNNSNLMTRLGRLAPNDPAAYQALEARATENYLSGMTHAAAWKEAIETAEKIPVSTHYVQEEGTRDGYGQVRVMRTNPDGTREEVAIYRPRTTDRGLWKAKQDALGRMTQENSKVRNAATRSVPVTGDPVQGGGTPKASDAAVTTTAGGDIDSDFGAAYLRLKDPDSDWVSLRRLRAELSNMGHSRAAQDEHLRKMNRVPGFTLAPESNQKILTDEDRAAAIHLGGQDKHIVAWDSPKAGTPAPSRRTELSVADQAAQINEDGARQLARENPARFLRVVGYRYFKMNKDHRKKENEQNRRAWEELNNYADQIDSGSGVEAVLHSIRLGHAGMMGVGRTMMTIRKVLDEEYNR
jgi:hypothetical protein